MAINPPLLHPGDHIAIISPATIVNPDYIDGACRHLRREGFVPVVMPHAKGDACGSYAASDADRLSDLIEAYRRPEIKAILCARGGYGCNHLLPRIPFELLRDNPKWLIGFSDISALHALSLRAGLMSLHAPMAKHLTLLPDDHYTTQALFDILRKGLPHTYTIPSSPLSKPGTAQGILVGGNLAVINGLAATPFDPLAPDAADNIIPGKDTPVILLIEDISEAIYAVERMLIRLILSDTIFRIKGLIIGQFTEYRPDLNFTDMESMISRLLADFAPDLKIPIAYQFPVGHVDENLPIPLGSMATLAITPTTTTLTMQYPK